jgi:hypothetical protein
MLSLTYIQLDILAFTCGLLLVCYLFYVKEQNARPPLPPGPKCLPFIGNTMDIMSNEKILGTYNRWAEEYGECMNS